MLRAVVIAGADEGGAIRVMSGKRKYLYIIGYVRVI